MKQSARLALSALAGISLATALHAYNHSVFSFKGSNAFESIQGELVLNLDAIRTAIPSGYSFETPVDFLHYTVRDASGVISRFTLNVDNPNVLTITKGADGSTAFLLVVEPVPTDPPFPGPLAFSMEFSFPGAAPWGDSVPDRTIAGASNVRLGASDLYTDYISIEEVTFSELARQLGAVNAELRRIRKYLAKGQKD